MTLLHLGTAVLCAGMAGSARGETPIFSDGFEWGDLSAWFSPACMDSGRLCAVACPNGPIEDLSTGAAIRLPLQNRVHVLLLPEGYLATDLASGVFDQDVADWLAEWRAIDVYSSFQNAFCVWKWSIPSAQRVAPTSPQTADTAFRVPISEDGDEIDASLPSNGIVAERVWSLLASFPYRPNSYYPAGGQTHNIAKNLVVAVMVYDASAGRSGLSGRARRLDNPSNPSQRVSAAFGHNRPHEFTHAFARLQDEYIETSGGALCVDNEDASSSAGVLNVVCSPQCGTLPWEHLIHGGSINASVEQLVGSFGLQDIGFHPELKCLMNGRHDNAAVFGGDGDLRVRDRMCNFCREMAAFRLFERTHLLDDPSSSYEMWVDEFRAPFFARFGFSVPAVVPQQNSDGDGIFHGCTSGSLLRDATTLPRAGIGPMRDGCDPSDSPD